MWTHGAAAVLGLPPWRSADAASSATPCGVFRWVPYSRDERMGLNHQMSSLSCAMNEAAALHRTLLLPPTMCIDGGHNKKRGGARCVPLESLFDLQLLHSFVPVRTSNASRHRDAADAASEFTTVKPSCDSRCAASSYKCEQHPQLQRRVKQGFWFQQCLQVRACVSSVRAPLGRTQPRAAPSLVQRMIPCEWLALPAYRAASTRTRSGGAPSSASAYHRARRTRTPPRRRSRCCARASSSADTSRRDRALRTPNVPSPSPSPSP